MNDLDLVTLLLSLVAAAHGPWRAPEGTPAPALHALESLVQVGALTLWRDEYRLSPLALASRHAYEDTYLRPDGTDTGPGWLADLAAWTLEARRLDLHLRQLPERPLRRAA